MPNDKDFIRKEKQRWLKETETKTKNRLERYMTTSSEDIPMLVTPDQMEDFDYLKKLIN